MAAERPRLIVAGGGTGGHVLAGIAVADEWKKKYGHAEDILFVGAHGGIEEKLVPRAGYRLELLSLGSLNSVGRLKQLKTLLQLPVALVKSLVIILNFKPDAALGVGGYASGPLVLVARLFTRTAIIEQNSVPGLTNRILGRWVHRVFCAFPGTEKRFPRAQVQVTGNPIRSTMTRMPSSAARKPMTVFAFGGSQGAAGINTLMIDAIAELGSAARTEYAWIHQTGERDYERVAARYRELGVEARVEKFIYDMPECYAKASLLVCRAGSGTLSEIAAVGRAAVFVPFPFASDNHQEVNARVFTDAGAGLLLRQQEAKGADLARILREAIASPDRLEKMESQVVAFYRPTAAADVVAALSAE